jgi:integrase
LIALLASTGLRVSEALALKIADITDDGLLIRETKFRKTRLVPLHDTAAAGLRRYLIRRANSVPAMTACSCAVTAGRYLIRQSTAPSKHC